MIVILGAGLAGLSTALHLEGLPWKIYEAEKDVGGLCRSMEVDGFTFDYTGHLLYLHHDPVKAFLKDLIQGKMRGLRRSAWIHACGTRIPFPYQVNTSGLPPEVRVECIVGFVQALMESRAARTPAEAPATVGLLDFLEQKRQGDPDGESFEAWTHRTFGPGFARHFFRPYNEKLWRRPLREMTSDWVSWSVPVPKLEDVLRGALGTAKRRFGYNTDILYPLEGGIRMLPDGMASRLGSGAPLRLGKRAAAIEAGRRKVRFEDGEEADYEWLVSTVPLNRLAAMIEDAPAEIKRAAASLESVSVIGVNVGLKGAFDHDHHWTYFPESEFVFYRTGYISNYSDAMAPEGHASLTAEVARRPDEPAEDGLEGRVVDDLVRAGVVRDQRDVVLVKTVRIDPAYVVFNQARQAALPVLFEYLMRNRIMPIGRYGAWDYLGMEDSILHGMQAADRLKAEVQEGG